MTVAELIAELQKLPPTWPVVIGSADFAAFEVLRVESQGLFNMGEMGYMPDEVCDDNACVLFDDDGEDGRCE